MSTVLYCVRLKKSELKSFVDSVRQKFIQTNPSFKDISKETPIKEILEILDKVRPLEQILKLEFQLFDEGDTWLVRPLEMGYYFWNNIDKFPSVEQVIYDGRVGEGTIKFEEADKLGHWVDERIHSTDYFIYPVITKDFMDSFLNDAIMSRYNK